ncbi:MAG: sigma-54-dependent Fis family transcriptional regulator [Anaerolineales bacterium]|nr:sigma-54-dependent Fis family transcriptional regulator [Anaerolineales bacterium]
MAHASILLIDDEEIIRDVISKLLEKKGYQVHTAEESDSGLKILHEQAIDLVLLDLMLPGRSGLESLEDIFEISPDVSVVMISAYASIENAVQATKMGAFDFVTKPFKNEELLNVIKNGLEIRSLALENKTLRKSFRDRYSFHNIIGKSEPMQKVFDLISNVGPSKTTCLITGESGTGKELVAKAIHNCSPRVEGPYVALNSGGIPSELIESELFGHMKGSFTGAVSNKKGLFEIGDDGTIFLDEISTIPLETQSKLLRVIQEREVRRVGGLSNIKVDARIVAATNTDLKKEVRNGRFREDLFYRLNVISIELPPLRDRKEDIPMLTDHFIAFFCKQNGRKKYPLTQDALKVLIEWNWPGNVRELENAIERAVVLVPAGGPISPEYLPSELLQTGRTTVNVDPDGSSLKDLVLEFEKNLILTALTKSDWNQKKAAGLLRVNPTTLNEKLKRLNIVIPQE